MLSDIIWERKMDGYAEAMKIDTQLNKLLMENSINRHNAREWLKLARTITTSAEILEEEAMEKLRAAPFTV